MQPGCPHDKDKKADDEKGEEIFFHAPSRLQKLALIGQKLPHQGRRFARHWKPNHAGQERKNAGCYADNLSLVRKIHDWNNQNRADIPAQQILMTLKGPGLKRDIFD